MASRTFDRTCRVEAPRAAVWERVVTPEGINDEMRPWMTMRTPRGAGDLTIDSVVLGQPIGRAWLWLFGVLPFDYDHLSIAELDPGRRFLERSTMLSMKRWQHERTLTDDGPEATLVHDRITLEPRVPIPGLAGLLARVLGAFFTHRHRRLRRHFD